MTKKYHARTQPITTLTPLLGATNVDASFTTTHPKRGIEICINHRNIISFHLDAHPNPSKGTFNSINSLIAAINHTCKKQAIDCLAEIIENSMHISSDECIEIIDTNLKDSLIKLMGITYYDIVE